MNLAPLTPWQKILAADSAYSCDPCRPGELAEFYWQTDCKSTEIISAFAIDAHPTVLADRVGPARLVGRSCSRCNGHIHVFSRTDAAERVKNLKAAWRHSADWAGAKSDVSHIVGQGGEQPVFPIGKSAHQSAGDPQGGNEAVSGEPASVDNFLNPRCQKPETCHFAHSQDACHDCLTAWSARPKDEQIRLWAEANEAARAAV